MNNLNIETKNGKTFEIYQIYKTSGSYDTYSDRPIKSFLSREKAEEEKAKLEAEEAILAKCR